MADLKFDCDKFENAIKSYDQTAEELLNLKDDLVNKMELLESNWQSDAGQKFSDLYNDNWVKHVKLYASVLQQLSKLLQKASDEYRTLEQKIPRIYQE